jgi:hypothetical protein
MVGKMWRLRLLTPGNCRIRGKSMRHVLTNFGSVPGTEDPSGSKRITKEIRRVMGKGSIAVVTIWSGMLPFLICALRTLLHGC